MIHGKRNKDIMIANAMFSYQYFINCFKDHPRKCEIHELPDNQDELCDLTIGHTKKWLVKQAKLTNYAMYMEKQWSGKFKFMIIIGLVAYLCLCYIAYTTRNPAPTYAEAAINYGAKSDL